MHACVCYMTPVVCGELIDVLVSCSSELLLSSSTARDVHIHSTTDHEHTKSIYMICIHTRIYLAIAQTCIMSMSHACTMHVIIISD